MLPLNRLGEFTERLTFLIKHRRHWASHNKVSCYRLYDEDVFPFLLDVYEDRIVWYVLEDVESSTMDKILETAAGALGWDRSKIYLKFRKRQTADAKYGRLDEKEEFLTVREGGLKFLVNLTDYLDTGLFLDHRWTRSYVRGLSAGRRVLNLFAYTGSFTAYAAQGGAFETTSVDLNANYLSWAEKNLDLNSLSGFNHHFLRRDVLEYLRTETRKTWDLIVLDPPTFSQSKKMDGNLDVQRDYPRMVQDCLRILAPDGVLFFSNNYQKFRFDPKILGKARVKEITNLTLPRDFRKGAHRCWLITHSNGPELTLLALDQGVA